MTFLKTIIGKKIKRIILVWNLKIKPIQLFRKLHFIPIVITLKQTFTAAVNSIKTTIVNTPFIKTNLFLFYYCKNFLSIAKLKFKHPHAIYIHMCLFVQAITICRSPGIQEFMQSKLWLHRLMFICKTLDYRPSGRPRSTSHTIYLNLHPR